MIDPTGHEVHWDLGEPTGPYLDDKEEKELPGTTEEGRIETLKDLVGVYLPKLVEKVQHTTKLVELGMLPRSSPFVLTPDLYEDEFTPKFHFHAYTLLGMAVKYVMVHGLQCQIAERI